MDLQDDLWINRAFGVPSQPRDRWAFYPWSGGWALEYRTKLALVLLNFACALRLVEQSCDRVCILFNSWLVFVVCDFVYRKYPWRVPIETLLWKVFIFCPLLKPTMPFVFFFSLFPVLHDCRLTYPSVAAFLLWVGCMVAWPITRTMWTGELHLCDDYDQFRRIRPWTTTIHTYVEQYLWVFLTLPVYKSSNSFFLFALVPMMGIGMVFNVGQGFLVFPDRDINSAVGSLVLSVGVALCIRGFYRVAEEAQETWAGLETDYSRQIIESELRRLIHFIEHDFFRPGGEEHEFFPLMAATAPLVLREAQLLLWAPHVDEYKKAHLRGLYVNPQIKRFRSALKTYGPYSSECCIS